MAMKLTDQQIEAAKSPRGAWTKATLAGWGVPWPPPRGWRTALRTGRPIPQRRSQPGRKRPNKGRSPSLSQLENQVYRLAAFLIERGHHDAAEALAGDARGAALYLAGPTIGNGEIER
jgi:hypothetical protein